MINIQLKCFFSGVALILTSVLFGACKNNHSSRDYSLVDTTNNIIINELFTTQTPSGKKVKVYLKEDTALYQHTLFINDQQLKFINDSLYDEPIDESEICRMAYFCSPDDRWLYVMLNPSIAGSCDIFYKIRLYRIDLESSQVKFLFNRGAVKLTKDGFVVAEQVEWVNEDENPCCADAIFTAQLVYYDFNGNETKRGEVKNGEDIFEYFISDYPPSGEFVRCYELNQVHSVI